MPSGQRARRHLSVNDISSYSWKLWLMANHECLAGSLWSRVAGKFWSFLKSASEDVIWKLGEFIFFFLRPVWSQTLINWGQLNLCPLARGVSFCTRCLQGFLTWARLTNWTVTDERVFAGTDACSGTLDSQPMQLSAEDAIQVVWGGGAGGHSGH